VERRLAAILAADVVGYSRLMGRDEAGTLAALNALRAELIDPKIAAQKGRIFKATGDGIFAEFPSVVNAVACAIEIQRANQARNADLPEERAIRLRIGVNVGDVIVESEDIFGDGVNVAARLEAIGPADGVAVSAVVRDQVGNRLDLQFEDMGEQELKNIDRPVRVFKVLPNRALSPEQPPLALPRKPSIAVLPFVNMSTDPEQEHFTDGLTEDLITDLSRNAGLFVIARNSTFAYKGKAFDVRMIARDLGVRYLLEGSARRSAGRVRINVQLIDAVDGGHMWAERFDRGLEDIFAVQDEVTAKILEALVGRLSAPPMRNRPKSVKAYDLCVRARPLVELSTQAAQEAQILLRQALAFDPDYAEAYRLLAYTLWVGWAHWGEPIEPNKRLSLEMAVKAVELDPNNAGCHWVLGLVLSFEKQWPESDAAFATALGLDPNNADAWATLSDLTVLSGRIDDGLDQIGRALRLNPRPDSWYYLLLGQAQYAARRYEAAVETLRREETYRTASRKFLAATLAQLGRLEEARSETQMFLVSNPHWTISHWVATQPLRDEATRAHFVDGYRKAGLPD
jgi:TolB-like protein/class 3 adenylate cyclase/cytochrome c-type biogenesis protein CcmH/NrfG